MFYKIVGQEVSGLDGFYGDVWEEYKNIGIEIPKNPEYVCNEIKEKLGISVMIVDANDYGREILGKSDDIILSNRELKEIIKDNPSGQDRELTPFVLIREKTKWRFLKELPFCFIEIRMRIFYFFEELSSKSFLSSFVLSPPSMTVMNLFGKRIPIVTDLGIQKSLDFSELTTGQLRCLIIPLLSIGRLFVS